VVEAWGGMPTGRVLTGKLLTPEQQQRLIQALRPALGGADPSKIPEAQRRAHEAFRVLRHDASENTDPGRVRRNVGDLTTRSDSAARGKVVIQGFADLRARNCTNSSVA
jgi:hypothetical protein